MVSSTQVFAPLLPGPGFAFNYQPSRIDRNALFAINQIFDTDKVAAIRTKYHRARLNIDALRSDLLEYEATKGPRKHSDAYYMVLESVDRDLFPDDGFKIVPWSHGSVIEFEDLPRNKSPGIPLKAQGYNTKGDALADPDVVKNIKEQWRAIESGRSLDLPDVACYARAQICTRDKNKVRATWGYPLTVFLTEAQYFYPFIDYVKNSSSSLLAYGIEMGNGGMQYLNEMAKSFSNPNIIIGDWSKFDKTVPAWLIRDAFKILERHICWDKVEKVKDKTFIDVKDFNSKARWKRIVKYFIDTPIQLSSGERWIKHGGVPSGSCFTNIIDSIVNAIVMRYLVYHQTGKLPLGDCFLGDDSVCMTTEPLNLEFLSEQAKDEFSMNFNPDKSYQTGIVENMHFLGYYNLFGQPYKPIDTVIASSIYPERPVSNKFETITRFIGQAYSCFEPEDAKRFFRCARLLSDECTNLEDVEVENYIENHPHQFKYLSTLGIKVSKGIKFPKFSEYAFVGITLPRACKKKYDKRMHDLHDLSQYIYYWKNIA